MTIQIKTYYESGHEQSRHTVRDRTDMQHSWARAINLLPAGGAAVLFWNGHEIERHAALGAAA